MKQSSHDLGLSVESLEAFVLRAPADPPVQTSFGTMRDRPAVLLRVSDADGCHGWGEIWCNFPSVGAEHRARLAISCLRPLVCGPRWRSPREAFELLSARFAVLMLQTGEFGPIRQMLAGLDIALWDLAARRCGLPLWKLLSDAEGAAAADPIPVYASGLNPTEPEKLAALRLAQGYRAFKLKVGFGAARDDANLRAVREVIGPDLALMVDANQAWNMAESVEAGRRMEKHDLGWLEEPLRADAPPEQWEALARAQPLALAGGENLAELPQFERYVEPPVGMRVVQPDIGKWGGFSGCLAVGRLVLSHGKLFCPHWLGGAIGQVASFHLKAAVGGPGYVEVDANINPLRESLAVPAMTLSDGKVQLGSAPGLGVEPDLDASREFIVAVSTVGL